VTRGVCDASPDVRTSTTELIAKPRRLSRVTVKFRTLSVRYRGRHYHGWAQVRYFWKNGEVFVRTTARLRR